MKSIKTIGLGVFLLAFGLFVVSITLSSHVLNDTAIEGISNEHHRAMFRYQAEQAGLYGKEYSNNFVFVRDMRGLLKQTQIGLDSASGVDPANKVWNATTLPDGVSEWEFRMGDYYLTDYLYPLTRYSSTGLLPNNVGLFFFLIFILGTLGALMYILPDLSKIPGIKHDHIFHRSATTGIIPIFQILMVVGTILYTLYEIYQDGAMYYFYGVLGFVVAVLGLITAYEARERRKIPPLAPKSTSLGNGWIGVVLGTFLISFYIVLYFHPYYITNWIELVNPIKRMMSGGKDADRWFLYGFLYTVVMLVMGIRMFIKYRHNKYQLVRTGSVLFFQLSFAFMLPEILGRFNNPMVDLKNAWPLDYSFFAKDRLAGMLDYNDNYFLGMHVGTSIFVWGIILTFILVPLFTYLYGKRWYCSWVCGCGGLAETLGDPFRQLSDKSVRAWRAERYIIYTVLVLVTVMSILTFWHYQTGDNMINIGFTELNAESVKTWYGFLIGSVFAGVVGTGFYPLMGNRMWCRYGCPLAGLMGIVQRFKSRFRITTNGGQCISCGNCSTYCEMGIDVRWYAQRGQDIVRASCVGCGVCSAVCPRGVLRLENSGEDVNDRAEELRTIHISADEVTFL